LVSENPWDRPFGSLEIVGLFAIGAGLIGYRVSRRLRRGPAAKVRLPYLKYLATFLLAMVLAWCLHICGMVYARFGVSPWAAVLAFFVPGWCLFVLNLPTEKAIRKWTQPHTS
jgi:hypothetical protein